MSQKLQIIIGGLIAGIITALTVEFIFSLTNGIILDRLIAIVVTMLLTGCIYALTYAVKGLPEKSAEGVLAGIFAGAIGGILAWAIGYIFFGPYETTNAILISGIVGGFLFGVQIDPKHA